MCYRVGVCEAREAIRNSTLIVCDKKKMKEKERAHWLQHEVDVASTDLEGPVCNSGDNGRQM